MVPAHGGSKVYTFTPKPTGTRWYHSHNVRRDGPDAQHLCRTVRVSHRRTHKRSGTITTRRCCSRRTIGRADGSVCRTCGKGRRPTMGLRSCTRRPRSTTRCSVMASRCASAKASASSSGCSTPARPRTSGWRFPGIASRCSRSTAIPCRHDRRSMCVSLGVAERADVVVEMNRPGVWILGEVDDDVPQDGTRHRDRIRQCSTASRNGRNRRNRPWDYTSLWARRAPRPSRTGIFALTFEKILGGRGGYNRWTINGKSWPDTDPLFTVEQGKRYRIVMNNNSGDTHPVHPHRHTFEVVKVGDKTTAGADEGHAEHAPIHDRGDRLRRR